MLIGKDRRSTPPLTPAPDLGNLLMLSLRPAIAPVVAEMQRFVVIGAACAGIVGGIVAGILLLIFRGF